VTANHHSQEDSEDRRIITISLLLLLVCSTSFALYKSNSAYSSDEVWSVDAAGLNYSSAMATLQADVHPPLYYQFLHLWIRVFGTGERAVRSLSGLFYVLSVFAVYAMGRDLYGSRTALLSATLYMISPLAILSAQFARMYALLSLLSVLSTWLYLQFSIKPCDSRLKLALYVAVNVLGTFTHVAFFFVLFGQAVFQFAFFRRARMRKLIFAMALSLVPYLFLWAPILLRQIARSEEGLAWLDRPGVSSIAQLLLLYGGNFWLLVPVFFYFWWRLGFKPLQSFSKLTLTSLPIWMLAVVVVLPFLISQLKPIFNPRFAIVGLPFFALSIGALIGRANNYVLPVALMVLTVIGLILLHPGSAVCNNRDVATHLSQTTNDGDVVIFTSLTRLPIDYYLEHAPTTRKLFETSFPAEIDKHPGYEGRITDPSRRAFLEREAQELVAKISEMRLARPGLRVFFLHGFHPQLDGVLQDKLRERFELVPGDTFKCDELSIYFKEVSVYK
jgi:mannosyltransferase